MMQELQGLARATIAAVQLELKKKAPPEVDIDTLEQQTLQDGPALGRQQRDVVVELGAGYRRMQTALETGAIDKFGRDFVHELKESCHKQNYLVEKCREIDCELQRFGQRAAVAKSTVQHFTHKRMRSVSVLQSRIREQGKRMSALREALEQQFLAMRELQHVKKMPEAYFKSLVEVVQRLAFQKGYRAQVDSMAETMAQLHEKEVSRRELFMKEYGQHLPKDLIPGLSNQLHPCEIRARSSDEVI